MNNNKKGYLLPMVIIYMIIAAVIGAGILVLGSFDRIEANKRLHREQAFYLAEAGINVARYDLAAMPTTPQTVNSGTWTGTFLLSKTGTDTVTVTATGTVKGVSEKTSLTVTKGVGGGVFSQGCFGKTMVHLYSGASIQGAGSGGSDGAVGTNGSLKLDSGALINGTAFLTGTALTGYTGTNITTVNKNYTFNDPLNPANIAKYWPAVTIPPSVYSPYSSPTTWPYTTTDSRFTGTGFTLSGGVFKLAGGNVTIAAGTGNQANFHFKEIQINNNGDTLTITGNAIFYFDGANGLHLKSQTSMTTNTSSTIVMYFSSTSPLLMDASSALTTVSGNPMDLQIYSAGTTVNLDSSALGLQGVVYAPNATVNLDASSTFAGCIMANDLELQSNAIATFNNIILGGTGNSFVNWTKPNWKR